MEGMAVSKQPIPKIKISNTPDVPKFTLCVVARGITNERNIL